MPWSLFDALTSTSITSLPHEIEPFLHTEPRLAIVCFWPILRIRERPLLSIADAGKTVTGSPLNAPSSSFARDAPPSLATLRHSRDGPPRSRHLPGASPRRCSGVRAAQRDIKSRCWRLLHSPLLHGRARHADGSRSCFAAGPANTSMYWRSPQCGSPMPCRSSHATYQCAALRLRLADEPRIHGRIQNLSERFIATK